MVGQTQSDPDTVTCSPTPPLETRETFKPLGKVDNGDSAKDQAGNALPIKDDIGELDGSTWAEPACSSELNNDSTYGWLKDISSRVIRLESKPSKEEENKPLEPEPEQKVEEPKIEPKVRDCNWEQFKNRYTTEDCTYAVETLLFGDDLDNDMEEEQLRRLSDTEREKFCNANPRKATRRSAVAKELDKQRIERVRVNSRAVLRLLSHVTGESWSDKPHTFLRPFKILIHFHEKMKEVFSASAAKFQACGEAGLQDSAQDPQMDDPRKETEFEDPKITSESKQPIETEQANDEITEGVNRSRAKSLSGESFSVDYDEYKEVQVYMKFVKDRLLPTYHMFDNLDHKDRPKVQFADLWSLFRPGELVFQRHDSPTLGIGNRHSPTGKKGSRHLWRVCWIQRHAIDWRVDNLDDKDATLRRNALKDRDDLTIQAYYIDFDGVSYHAVGANWTIKWFDGDKDVTKLEVCPVRFEKDYEATISQLRERGERFKKLVSEAQIAIAHDGWTLTKTRLGLQIDGYESQDYHPPWSIMAEGRLTSEYIDSDVIVDFQEAYQAYPWWKPSFMEHREQQFDPDVELDNFAIIWWSGPGRSQVIRKTKEIVVDFDDVDFQELNEQLKHDDFLVSDEFRTTEKDANKQKFTPEDIALLPERLCVYSLRQRRFVNADIANLKQLPTVPNPLNDLKISDTAKSLIKSIVQDHFDKKKVHRNIEGRGIEPLEQDFIRGKGKGLVILLHGAPGVGKTATAEAVAAAHQKPLFPITCGDLGVNITMVEKTLSEIFRLANLWDCVLLFDEAEIFLSHRQKKDDNLQRNALVSIFLRTLEYYQGILFLTTNRVGALDEALNSRVHISLFFDHLDLEQTLALFRLNSRRSIDIAEQRAADTGEPVLLVKNEEIDRFAYENFLNRPNNSDPWWNGRQIRNAFQIATSLAYVKQKNHDEDSEQWFLGRKHFEQVLSFIQYYEDYRQNLFKGQDTELAAKREERPLPPRKEHSGGRTGHGPSPSYAQQNPSFFTPPPGSRAMSDRQRGSEYMRHGPHGSMGSSSFPREPSPSPNYGMYDGGSSQRSIPRMEYEQDYRQ
ncbi:hypothetical protein NW768_004921 [Fusarium equiseti]|uniref:AAA+ ATPase domain-containing protein n=1 Tax=Fusarium equiseti TaxID=61235 RepID=A0ABQ8RHL1_FUSEQ|nr:hypothetical protein NW768_004921 [Fusarium equiseti]